jgi:hypothetical protein
MTAGLTLLLGPPPSVLVGPQATRGQVRVEGFDGPEGGL